jgi:hypothetical protein
VVTITGSAFTGAGNVHFGPTPALSFKVVNDTSMTATSPANATAGAVVNVIVNTPGGNSANSSADRFAYGSLPTVTGISPTYGPAAGGTNVTITGSAFTGAGNVHFGPTPALSFNVINDTSMMATSPANATFDAVVNVIVSTPVGDSATSSVDKFAYGTLPTVTSISPTAGPTAGGTVVTITGSAFTGVVNVHFGPTPALSFNVINDNSISATSPANATAGTVVNVIVNTPVGNSPTSSADKFTYVAVPAVAGISPSSGPTAGGTNVTITGSGFTGATAVMFGSNAATNVTVTSATKITATAPENPAGVVDVTVTTPGGTSAVLSADKYTYDAIPIITGISPSSGPLAAGTSVIITGTALSGATSVKFGTTAGTITANTGTSISLKAPAGTAGVVDVTVTTPGGTSAFVPVDQYTYHT